MLLSEAELGREGGFVLIVKSQKPTLNRFTEVLDARVDVAKPREEEKLSTAQAPFASPRLSVPPSSRYRKQHCFSLSLFVDLYSILGLVTLLDGFFADPASI